MQHSTAVVLRTIAPIRAVAPRRTLALLRNPASLRTVAAAGPMLLLVVVALSGCVLPTAGPSSHSPDDSTTAATDSDASASPHASSSDPSTQPSAEPDPSGAPGVASEACPGHWHANLEVWIHGHPISFDDPAFYLEGRAMLPDNDMPVSSHMHRGDDREWHFEPNPVRCIPLGDALPYIGVRISTTAVELTGAHDHIHLNGTPAQVMQAARYEIGETGELRFFVQDVATHWREVGRDEFLGDQPMDGAKLLVVLGEPTEHDVRSLEADLPPPKDFVSGYRQLHDGQDPEYPPPSDPAHSAA